MRIYQLITPDGIMITRRTYRMTHLHYALLYRLSGQWMVRWFKVYDEAFRLLMYVRRDPTISNIFLVPVTEHFAVKADDPELPPFPHDDLEPVNYNTSGHKIPTALVSLWSYLTLAADREKQAAGLLRFTPQAYDEHRLLKGEGVSYERVLRITALFYQTKHGYEDMVRVLESRLAGTQHHPTTPALEASIEQVKAILDYANARRPLTPAPFDPLTLKSQTFYALTQWLGDAKTYLRLTRRLQSCLEKLPSSEV